MDKKDEIGDNVPAELTEFPAALTQTEALDILMEQSIENAKAAGVPVAYPEEDGGIMNKIETFMLNNFGANGADIPIKHTFGEGLYIRDMFLKKGEFLIGHPHTTDHIIMVMKGKISIFMGDEVKTYEAPAMLVGRPGQKAGVALEDTHLVSPFTTDLDTVEAIEDKYLKKSQTYLNYMKDKEAWKISLSSHSA